LFGGSFFISPHHAPFVSVDCVIELTYQNEKAAEAVLAAIAPDNAPYAQAERHGPIVTVTARTETPMQMLHTMEDLLACVRVAEGAVGLSD
jgi:hypothetical protein